MIKFIWIDNFKSLVDFELELSKFSCLVGLNGSGKSTVLQAMDFLSQLMVGSLDDWLKERQWESVDLNSKLTPKSNIDFKVVIDSVWGELTWGGSINRRSLRCTQELITHEGDILLSVADGQCRIRQLSTEFLDQENKLFSEPLSSSFRNSYEDKNSFVYFPIVFNYEGSILSQLKDNQSNILLQTLKESILQIRSLDLLSPELLRSRTKLSSGKLGLGGQHLSAFIHESGKEGKDNLKRLLGDVYEQLVSIETRSLRSGWKQLEITEQYSGQTLKSTARHINDGLLRLMAVFAQLEGNNAFLIFDEIENGINSELIEFLIDHLVEADHQVLVTTHSPMILNFLEDEVALDAVIYLYKNQQGFTRSIKFFDIPSMAKKLQFMGVGEVFVDTDLTLLYQEIESL